VTSKAGCFRPVADFFRRERYPGQGDRLNRKQSEEKKTMKRQLFAIGVFALLTCSGLLAQENAVRVDVPFGFRLNTAAMPAGEYLIKVSNGVLIAREVNGKASAMSVTSTTIGSDKGRPLPPRLVFTRYGNESFLSGLWTGQSTTGYTLPETKHQKELAARYGPVEATTIASRTK
jgi:hypothetical protein